MADLLTNDERALVERLKAKPLRHIERAESCALLDIIHRLAPPEDKTPEPWCAFCKRAHPGGDSCMGHHP